MSEKEIERLVQEKEALKQLLFGEWVDTDLIQSALNIDFSSGMAVFDFSRTAEWNPPPLNGQKIITKFKLKAPAIKIGAWERGVDKRLRCSRCGSRALYKEGGTVYARTYYSDRSSWCPSCGAAMMKNVEE